MCIKVMKRKTIHYFLACCFILLLLSNVVYAEKLSLNMDIKQYRFNKDSSLVEIYLGILTADTNKTQPDQFVLEFTINSKGKSIVKNLWRLEEQLKYPGSQFNHQMIVDILKYLLPAGVYDFKLIAKNLSKPEEMDSTEIKDIPIKIFDRKKTEISDIELAQIIVPSHPQKKNRFDKNRFKVVPNPLNLFDQENQNVYYYLELYNLTESIKSKYFYIRRTIVNSNGLPLVSLPIYQKKKRLLGNDVVEVGMFDVSTVPSGKYYLNFSVCDSSLQQFASSSTGFFVHNPAVIPGEFVKLSDEDQMAGSEIALLTEENIEDILVVTKYFLNTEEKKIIENLKDLQAKKLFLYNYWKNNDKDNNTPILESFREILTRMRFANTNFSTMKEKGWQTDRGRVLILYGKPSEIQRYPNVADFKEFQAWSYDNIENGVVFIFGVLGSFGNLQLIHSTKTGEISNEYWFDLIKVSVGKMGIGETAEGYSTRNTIRDMFRKYNLELPRYLK